MMSQNVNFKIQTYNLQTEFYTLTITPHYFVQKVYIVYYYYLELCGILDNA